MPVRVIFRCSVCGAFPDEAAQATMRSQLAHLRHGEFLDASPRAG